MPETNIYDLFYSHSKPVLFRFRYLFWVLLPFLYSVAAAQVKYKISYYTAEQGLSHEAVTAMVKDSEGFMWFGTWNGINRFDGHQFVSFKSVAGDSSVLRNNRIVQIVTGKGTYLWVKSYDNHLYRFDKSTARFLQVLPSDSVKASPELKNIRIVDASGEQVWFACDGGLYGLPQDNPAANHLVSFSSKAREGHRLPANRVNFFFTDKTGKIWVGTPGGLACMSRAGNGVYKTLPLPASIQQSGDFVKYAEDEHYLFFADAGGRLVQYNTHSGRFRSSSLTHTVINGLLKSKSSPCLYITTAAGTLMRLNAATLQTEAVFEGNRGALYNLFEDRAGRLWLEPEKKGVLLFNPRHNSFTWFYREADQKFKSTLNRFKIIEDHNGVVWVNVKGGTLAYYDTARNTIEYFLNNPAYKTQGFSGVVNGMYLDEAGVLWLVPEERGLIKLIFQNTVFQQHLVVPDGVFKSENEIRGLLLDRQGRLWLGAKSGRLYVKKDNRFLPGLPENEPDTGLGQIYGMMQDSRGNIWLGTKSNGLFLAIPLNKEASRYRLTHFTNTTVGVPEKVEEIYSLAEDKSGRIWIGSYTRGLLLATYQGTSIQLLAAKDRYPFLPNTHYKIRHLALDNAGHLWVGSTDGLMVLKAGGVMQNAGAVATYTKKPGDKFSLGNSDVQFIFKDSQNSMWLATGGGGLSCATGADPFHGLTFINYTTNAGLPNDFVLSITEDKKQRLWMATENGLSRFCLKNKTFRNYSSYDGLPASGFSEGAAACLPNGDIVFGAMKGLLQFNPDKVGAAPITAHIALTGFHINSVEAGRGIAAPDLSGDINYRQQLQLSYNQNTLGFDFAILDNRVNSHEGLAYRLVGLDSVWHASEGQQRVTYANLTPGKYCFEVKTLNTDLYSSLPYKRLHIVINAPPWKTWWAYGLYILVTLALAYIIWRIAVTMIGLRNKITVERKLTELKLNFFTNISHELRTPLTLIVGPIDQLIQKEQLSDNGKQYLELLRSNANRMVRFVNQLLDFRKIQHKSAVLKAGRIELMPFVQHITDNFQQAALAKGITIQVQAQDSAACLWADAEKLDVIVYNLLSNALKFAPPGQPVVLQTTAVQPDQYIEITVLDHGPGVPEDKLRDIFELFYEGDPLHPGQAKGSGIGLALCKELVELHGGTIQAENRPSGGLAVTVRMKAGNTHFNSDQLLSEPVPVTVNELPERAEWPGKKEEYPGLPAEAPLVLLVEDNDDLRSFLHMQLSECYRVETAANGQEGLEAAGRLLPDLILSDIMMPVMNGIDMLNQLKKDSNTSHIPVVLLSARHNVESQIQGLKYGADYYITKPFHNDFLMAAIDNLLRQRRQLFDRMVSGTAPVTLTAAPVVITSKDELFLKEVVRIVDENMMEADFNIEGLADKMNMGRATFYKKFKSLSGMTPVEFVRDMRLQRAKQYLDAGGHTVAEVAYLTGFSSPKYFSTCFREKYNVSPSVITK